MESSKSPQRHVAVGPGPSPQQSIMLIPPWAVARHLEQWPEPVTVPNALLTGFPFPKVGNMHLGSTEIPARAWSAPQLLGVIATTTISLSIILRRD